MIFFFFPHISWKSDLSANSTIQLVLETGNSTTFLNKLKKSATIKEAELVHTCGTGRPRSFELSKP
jgi:hypothetical protein